MVDEVEIKIRVDDAEETAARIDALGAALVRERTFEDNRVFDLDDGTLARQGKLLRLRVSRGQGVVTVKAPAPEALGSPFKIRREIETAVADPAAMAAALESVGLFVGWRYQKYRREWSLGDARIFLDEIPWGVWLEIEGEPERIEEIARSLGCGRDRWERASYRELHERHCAGRGLPPGPMVFESGDRK
jgi:adenylate cyclase class 2